VRFRSSLLPARSLPAARRYADAAKNRFKKPTRLECMMQDHPKVLGPGARVGFTSFDDWTYSPVKNSVDEARAKLAVGAPGRSAVEGELEYYAAGGRLLAAAGVAVPAPGALSVFGFSLPAPVRAVFFPRLAPSLALFRARFPTPAAVRLSAASTLVVDAADCVIEALDLDGTLLVRAVDGAHVIIRRLRVANAGWPLVPLTADVAAAAPDSVRIRGFRVDKREQRVLEFTAPGEYIVDEA